MSALLNSNDLRLLGEHTVALPPIEEAVDEETLDEHDGVPPVVVEHRDENGHAGRRALFALLVLVLIVAVCGVAVWGLWRSHFVGAESDGQGGSTGPAGEVVEAIRAMGGEAVANGADVAAEILLKALDKPPKKPRGRPKAKV